MHTSITRLFGLLLLVVAFIGVAPPAQASVSVTRKDATSVTLTPEAYFVVSQALANIFVQDHGMSITPAWRASFDGRPVMTGCARQPQAAASIFAYCSRDDTVYETRETIMQLARLSWIGPIVATIHEMGHAAQGAHGMGAMSPDGVLSIEAQADCFAGVWALTTTGWLRSELLPSAPAITTLLSSAEKDEQVMVALGMYRSHPVPTVRIAAYATGFATGTLAACDTLAPTQVSP